MKPIGMNYPIIDGNTGYFEQTYDSFSNERVKLINLMETMEGERPMNPLFGIGLHKYLFEPLDNALKTKIENEITKKITFWLPLVVILDLVVDILSNGDKNTINVSLKYTIQNYENYYDIITKVV